MKVETAEEWARRVAREIRAGQMQPTPTEEPAKHETSEAALQLARQIGREFAERNGSIASKLKPYMIE